MRILAHVHGYVPSHNAGAERMLHSTLTWLAERGHECRVLTGPGHLGPWEGELDGVDVVLERGDQDDWRHYDWSEVVLTHLDRTVRAIAMSRARKHPRPLVQLVHNPWSIKHWGIKPEMVDLTVFNSFWLMDSHRWCGPQTVLHPPVWADDYAVERADADRITLVNLNENKGARTFYAVARLMPERRFLGVLGAYDAQVVERLPNVEVLPNTGDMRAVYARTRVLLCPSGHESWGRVGIEAAASGIPTVAHHTPGLEESLGDAGTFADRERPEEWVDAIRRLDDAAHYSERSRVASERSRKLDPEPQLFALEQALQQVQTRQRARQVDFVASLSHYVDHVAPVWRALPAVRRGSVHVPASLVSHAVRKGVVASGYEDTPVASLCRSSFGPVMVVGYSDWSMVRDCGRPLVMGEHGAGQTYAEVSHGSYAGNPGKEGTALFVVPGPHPAARIKQNYPDSRCVEVGSPRLDEWLGRQPKRKTDTVVAVSFHWDCALCPEAGTSWRHFWPGVLELATRYLVIGHAHPRIWHELERRYRDAGIEPVRDFDEVLARADVYACDNSSTLFEFAATDRPVVVLDSPAYRRDVHHGLRFWDCADIGVRVDRPECLLAAVGDAVSHVGYHPAAARRREVARQVFSYLDGSSAARAARAILEVPVVSAPTPSKAPIEMIALKEFSGIEGFMVEGRRFAVGRERGLLDGKELWVDAEHRARQLESRKQAVRVQRPTLLPEDAPPTVTVPQQSKVLTTRPEAKVTVDQRPESGEVTLAHPTPEITTVNCHCGKRFSTLHALDSHMARAHKPENAKKAKA